MNLDFSLMNKKPSLDTARVVLARLRLSQGLLNTAADEKPILFMNPAYQRALMDLNKLIHQVTQELGQS